MKTLLLAISLLCLSSCAAAVDNNVTATMEPAGFWYGLWHGFIIDVSFVCSLFYDSVSIYATHNNGGWYDFGFMIGLALLGRSVAVLVKFNTRQDANADD